MRVGVPKEIKDHEYRVGLTPQSVRALVAHGHHVLVERGAGAGIDASDDAYRSAGASVLNAAAEVFAAADMIVKVKEPQQVERRALRPGQILFTYLHLAADSRQTDDLLESGAVAIAYETVTADRGGLPLLAPMSQVAGRMAVQAAAHFLEAPQGGRGVLMSGAAGVASADVVILGSGVVGSNAAMLAAAMGASVTVLDLSPQRLQPLESQMGTKLRTAEATSGAIAEAVQNADCVIGAALIPGARSPRLVTRAMLATMRRGAVLVDVSIDQGGCFETSHPTTHAAPTFEVDGVVHYCVANMPGAVPHTSTVALNNATLPYVLAIADHGWQRALTQDRHLRDGLNVCRGQLTNGSVAEALGAEWTDPDEVLA